tara:strand:- start:311 stop:433 length:123 start_codon:yes stop_codon:yes gene_type:complete
MKIEETLAAEAIYFILIPLLDSPFPLFCTTRDTAESNTTP